MAYVIVRGDEALDALSRAIVQQGDKIAEEGGRADKDRQAFVHKARVRCKRIRAGLALARPVLGHKRLRKADKWWRDAARVLSEARDSSARHEALEALRPHLEAVCGEAAVRALAARLRLQQRLAGAHRHEAAAIRAFLEQIEARNRNPLADGEDTPVDMLRDGLAASYRASRKAMREALEAQTPEAFHEWRKRAKAHGLQLRLCREMFPLVVERVAAVRDLAECLGAVQDAEVLLAALDTEAGQGMDGGLRAAIIARSRAMQADAAEQGHALFGEKTPAWAGRALDVPTPDAPALDVRG